MASSFICTVCGRKVNYAKHDPFFKEHDWRCLECIFIIKDKEYPPGEITVFTHVGECLGGNTVFELIRAEYLKNNPHETVVFLNPDDDHKKMIEMISPDKIFYSELFTEDTQWIQSHPKAIYYNMLNEVCAYAEEGIYPKLSFEPVRPPVYIPERFVVLHIRNLERAPERNMPQSMVSSLIKIFERYGLPVVILGNDEVDDVWGIYEQIYDYRKQLSLEEIACILSKSLLYCGVDSGLMHVAAACGCNIVSWNHAGPKWFPKCANYKSFVRGVKEEEILESVENECR